jgi:hypothetical protein
VVGVFEKENLKEKVREEEKVNGDFFFFDK